MPLGILREALPSVGAHHDVFANLGLTETGLSAHNTPHRAHVNTSFADSQITTCQEGFRCVSRVKRFGFDHTKEVLRDKARMAQADNAEMGEEGKDGKAPTDAEVEEYEWNCPVQGNWVQDRFESGVEANQCREEKDCICIARGAEDSFTELKDGIEKRHETVEAEIGCGGGKSQKLPLIVIPHYPLRRIPESYDPMNINSSMGDNTEFPATGWVNSYKNNAPKMQYALDSLKTWINDTYEAKVADKPYVCGPPVPGQESTMSDADVHEASVKIRNFQVLQKDCENMRDTVPLLISPTSEKVSPPGTNFMQAKKKLNCYKLKNASMCVQLNCYTGHDDTVFKDHLREFEARMMACEPEPEDINAEGRGDGIREEAAPPTAATAEKAAVGTGAVTGGAETVPPAATQQTQTSTVETAPTPDANGGTAQQGVGAGTAALAVLLGSSRTHLTALPHPSPSKRNGWRRFL